MNSSSTGTSTSTNIATKSYWKNAFIQYLKLLKRIGGKCIYTVQWAMFNFGFHLIVSWGLYKSYHHIRRLKFEIGPNTVKGGRIETF